MTELVLLVLLCTIPFLRSIRGECLFDDPLMFDVGQTPAGQRTLRAFHAVPRDLVHIFDGWLWKLFGINTTGMDELEITIIQPMWPWHALSIAFHIGTTLCLYSLITSLHLLMDSRAFWAAAIFAVHPLQVTAIAYISGRAGVQAAFFSGLGFLHAMAGGWHWLAVPVCHYFAWKSKEDGLMYLAFYPVILWKSLAWIVGH